MNYQENQDYQPEEKKKKKGRFIAVVILVIAVVIGVLIVNANKQGGTDASGENGEESDVILIYNADDFLKLNQEEPAKFRLANDIDFSGVTWEPFAFFGELDGNGYALLNIGFPNLFTANDGTIKNLKIRHFVLEDFNIPADTFVGLVNENRGKISHCTISDSTLKFADSLGFFANYNNGVVENCAVTSTTVQAYKTNGGGIVRENYAEVTGCYTELSITTYRLNFGGIAQYNDGNLTTCYSKSNISAEVSSSGVGTHIVAEVRAGSIAACNYRKISECYGVLQLNASAHARNDAPTASMLGTKASALVYVGGLAGINLGEISNSFADFNIDTNVDGYDKGGDLTLANHTGNLHGYCANEYQTGTLLNSYYCQEGYVVAQKKGTTVAYNQDGSKAGTASLRQKDFCVGTLGWNENDWVFSSSEYPRLKWTN